MPGGQFPRPISEHGTKSARHTGPMPWSPRPERKIVRTLEARFQGITFPVRWSTAADVISPRRRGSSGAAEKLTGELILPIRQFS
jgi:hypothetical protein